MGEKIATRAAYGKALVEFAPAHPELVVLDADLSGSTNTSGFAKACPDRFFDLGIAEQNMIGVAAGLATCGKHVFANSFAVFSSGRAFDQVRTSVALPKLNVTVVGSHGGLSVGEDGPTHQSCEDLAAMSALPNMTVLCPCDGNEMRLAVKALLEDHQGPAYLRMARLATDVITDAIPGYTFQIGKGVTLREGTDVTIVATGMMVAMALEAASQLEGEGVHARVLNIHTIKPLDRDLILKAAKETGCIVTTEEHNIIGGLGSAVASYLSETCPTPVVRHGVPDCFGRSGAATEVLDHFGLNPAGIVDAVHKALALKKD